MFLLLVVIPTKVGNKASILMESRCSREEPFPISLLVRIIHPPRASPPPRPSASPNCPFVRNRNRLLSFPRRACACSLVSSLVGFSVPDKLGEDRTYCLALFYRVSSSPSSFLAARAANCPANSTSSLASVCVWSPTASFRCQIEILVCLIVFILLDFLFPHFFLSCYY